MINVLLVEDDPDDVVFVSRAFEKVCADCKLHVVNNGEAAVQYLRREADYGDAPAPDLILLDLNMPKKNGYEVLLDVKQDERLKHIPIVVLTTSGDRDSVLKAYRLHANSYIAKPISAEQFEKVVESLIQYWFDTVGLPQGA